MGAFEFWPGQTLEIHINQKIYYTQIIGNQSDLKILKPVNRERVSLLIEDSKPVNIFFYTAEGNDVYTFKTDIYINNDKEIMLRKPSEEEVERAQRRKMFRVQIGVPIDVIKQNPKNTIETVTESHFTKDISGGGMAILYRDPMGEAGDYVYGNIHLDTKQENTSIPFKGEVVSVSKADFRVYKTALQFVDMSERDQEKIIKFCMLKQVEQSRL